MEAALSGQVELVRLLLTKEPIAGCATRRASARPIMPPRRATATWQPSVVDGA